MKLSRLQPAMMTITINPSSSPPTGPRTPLPRSSGDSTVPPLRFEGLAEFGLPARAIRDLPLELAAGRVDVVAPGPAHGGQYPRLLQQLLECADVCLGRTLETGAGERIERDQVDLGRVLHLGCVVELAHQSRELAR